MHPTIIHMTGMTGCCWMIRGRSAEARGAPRGGLTTRATRPGARWKRRPRVRLGVFGVWSSGGVAWVRFSVAWIWRW